MHGVPTTHAQPVVAGSRPHPRYARLTDLRSRERDNRSAAHPAIGWKHYIYEIGRGDAAATSKHATRRAPTGCRASRSTGRPSVSELDILHAFAAEDDLPRGPAKRSSSQTDGRSIPLPDIHSNIHRRTNGGSIVSFLAWASLLATPCCLLGAYASPHSALSR